MVQLVRAGVGVRTVARRFSVSTSTVTFWVERARGQRLDRVDWQGRRPGRAWNRLNTGQERRIVRLRQRLRHSALGEFGAGAIRAQLQRSSKPVPCERTIHRVLQRHGVLDGARRQRRAAPPKGWYLPAVARGAAELDCFDFIEALKIAAGPLVDVLTAKSLHGQLVDAWVLEHASAQAAVDCLLRRWRRDGLPAYAQFDNDTIFQGAHQFADTVGRVSRLCLALGVTPVFVPPLEHGMQNGIEGFNALWQAKVWQRYRVADVDELRRRSARYIAAHRARHAAHGIAQRRLVPPRFRLNLQAPLRGCLLYIRRTDEHGAVNLLGHHWLVSIAWAHRLVRCEVDFDRHRIRCFGLRRAAPVQQPLLATFVYERVDKPFQGVTASAKQAAVAHAFRSAGGAAPRTPRKSHG